MVEIGLGLGLIDRLIQLLKFRQERNEKQFRELAQKVFTDLEVVHTDYLLFIESAKNALEGGTDPKTILDKFEVDRLQKEPLRRRTVQLLVEAKDQEKFSSLRPFLIAAARYFTTTSAQSEIGNNNTLSRTMESILKGLAGEHGDPPARAKALTGFKGVSVRLAV